MKILMMQSVGTAKGAFNAKQVYDVDSDIAKEWIELGYAVRAGVVERQPLKPLLNVQQLRKGLRNDEPKANSSTKRRARNNNKPKRLDEGRLKR